MTRGQRNNNPLNIRHSSSRWQGRSTVQNDSSFVQFISVEFGIRAAFMLIRTYVYKYKCDTISSIIKRWAPPSDGNNTSAYISYIETRLYQDMEEEMKVNHQNIDIPFLRLYSSPTLPRNFFVNKKCPSAFCKKVVRYMAEIESNMHLSDAVIEKAIQLL